MSASLVTRTSYNELIAYLDALDEQISQFLDDITAFAIALQDTVAAFQRDQYDHIYGRGGFLEVMEIQVANGIAAVRKLVDQYDRDLTAHLSSYYITESHLPYISNVAAQFLANGQLTQDQLTKLQGGWYYAKAPRLQAGGTGHHAFNMAQPLVRRLQKIEANLTKYTDGTEAPFGIGYFNQRRACQAISKLIMAVPFSSTIPDSDDLFLEEYTSGELYLGSETIVALPIEGI